MIKKFRSIAVLSMLVIVGIVLFACENVEPITVTFDTQGGSTVEPIIVTADSPLSLPDDPSQEGYTFVGWYADAEGLTAFSADILLESNITVYAVWSLNEFTVTFDVDGGSSVDAQTVGFDSNATTPTEPAKEGYEFAGWFVGEAEDAYDFTSTITENITLTARWVQNPEALIAEDIAAYMENMYDTKYKLNLPSKGAVNRSSISWSFSSPYLLDNGIILPINADDVDDQSVTVTATFYLAGVTVRETFEVQLTKLVEVELTNNRAVDFESLTSEYDLPDQQLTLYFEDDGYVPYVKISDFFALLDTGFIGEEYELTFTEDEGTLEIYYQYYDEDFDEIYDLYCTLDANDNTISTNDPGFYWAYVSSTETNYGRHIVYDYENEGSYYEEGNDVIYDLSAYNMDITTVDGEVVAPYYIVNQLFAGSSYFNVYYNYDGLYGIYSLPGAGSDAYETIKSSSMNSKTMPADLAIHTFNMLAFDLDYFYGLKDIMAVDTYYDLLYDNVDQLVTTSSRTLDQMISDIILDNMDEMHTSYGYPSYFNSVTWDVEPLTSIEQLGTRYRSYYEEGLWDVDDALAAKWGYSDGWIASSGLRPNYWFLDNQTVMLSLDDFNTADIEESAAYDANIAKDILETEQMSAILPDIVGGSKFFFYNWSSEDNRLLEVLVKGLDATYVATYKEALVTLGYTLVTGDSDDPLKADGYYQKSVGEFTYMTQVTFDEELGIFYVSVADEVPENYDDDWMLLADVFGSVYADSAVYMELMLEQIVAEQPGVTHIILDLTWNMGGNLGALYRVMGFITDEPFFTTSYSRATDSSSKSYVTIEGIPSYSHLNWSLLTSKVTYSAANEMATMFMANDIGPIIGVQAGGGTASITPILLPSGTAFTMSSNSLNGYFTGAGTEEDPYVFYDNEFGIVPDYPLDTEDLYDEALILEILYP